MRSESQVNEKMLKCGCLYTAQARADLNFHSKWRSARGITTYERSSYSSILN